MRRQWGTLLSCSGAGKTLLVDRNLVAHSQAVEHRAAHIVAARRTGYLGAALVAADRTQAAGKGIGVALLAQVVQMLEAAGSPAAWGRCSSSSKSPSLSSMYSQHNC